MGHELRDVAPGLWVWRHEHPDWKPGLGWEGMVTSTCVESGGEVALLDALAPPEDAAEIWARLDARPPTYLVAGARPGRLRAGARAPALEGVGAGHAPPLPLTTYFARDLPFLRFGAALARGFFAALLGRWAGMRSPPRQSESRADDSALLPEAESGPKTRGSASPEGGKNRPRERLRRGKTTRFRQRGCQASGRCSRTRG